jgi:hypothetical protein
MIPPILHRLPATSPWHAASTRGFPVTARDLLAGVTHRRRVRPLEERRLPRRFASPVIAKEDGRLQQVRIRERGRWPFHGAMSLAVMAGLIGTFALVRPSPGGEFTCAAGDVSCLIEAIHAANDTGEANTLTLEAGLYTLTVADNFTDGPNGLPSITGSLTIQGAGAQGTILERAPEAPDSRLLHIAPTGALTLEGLTLLAILRGVPSPCSRTIGLGTRGLVPIPTTAHPARAISRCFRPARRLVRVTPRRAPPPTSSASSEGPPVTSAPSSSPQSPSPSA